VALERRLLYFCREWVLGARSPGTGARASRRSISKFGRSNFKCSVSAEAVASVLLSVVVRSISTSRRSSVAALDTNNLTLERQILQKPKIMQKQKQKQNQKQILYRLDFMQFLGL
jgi:hypothetical protein